MVLQRELGHVPGDQESIRMAWAAESTVSRVLLGESHPFTDGGTEACIFLDQISVTTERDCLECLWRILSMRISRGTQPEDELPEDQGLMGNTRLSLREQVSFSKGIALMENPKENTQKWSKKEKSVLTVHQA